MRPQDRPVDALAGALEGRGAAFSFLCGFGVRGVAPGALPPTAGDSGALNRGP